MSTLRLASFLLALTLAVTACSSDSASDNNAFAEQRELGTVYQLLPHDLGDDPTDELRETQRWLHAELAPEIPFDDLRADGFSVDGLPGITVDPRNSRTWAFSIDGFLDDQTCEACAPITLTEDEMVALASDLWTRLGVDTDVARFRPFNDGPLRTAAVSAFERRDGVLTSLEWTVQFGGDTDGIRAASGYWGSDLVEIGQVPLLTVQEAYAQRDLPYLETDAETVELGSTLILDRGNGNYYQVPAWWIQPDALAAPIALDAYRHGDLADIEPAD